MIKEANFRRCDARHHFQRAPGTLSAPRKVNSERSAGDNPQPAVNIEHGGVLFLFFMCVTRSLGETRFKVAAHRCPIGPVRECISVRRCERVDSGAILGRWRRLSCVGGRQSVKHCDARPGSRDAT